MPGVSPCRRALMVVAKERDRRVEVCEASRQLAQHPFHHILPATQVQEGRMDSASLTPGILQRHVEKSMETGKEENRGPERQ